MMTNTMTGAANEAELTVAECETTTKTILGDVVDTVFELADRNAFAMLNIDFRIHGSVEERDAAAAEACWEMHFAPAAA